MWAGLTPAILQQPNNQPITPQHMAAPSLKHGSAIVYFITDWYLTLYILRNVRPPVEYLP
jgi:hypothetical protein